MKYIFILTILVFSCNQSPKVSEAQAADLQKAVFKIHDEVMPKTMKIEDVQAEIRTKVEKNTQLKTEGLAINSAMQAASDSMYAFMAAMTKAEELPLEQKVAQMQVLKTKGETIKTATENSLQKADEFLKKK